MYDSARAQIDPERAREAAQIDPPVAVESPVFDRQHGMGQHGRQLRDLDGAAVNLAGRRKRAAVGRQQRNARLPRGPDNTLDVGKVVSVPSEHRAQQHEAPDGGDQRPAKQSGHAPGEAERARGPFAALVGLTSRARRFGPAGLAFLRHVFSLAVAVWIGPKRRGWRPRGHGSE